MNNKTLSIANGLIILAMLLISVWAWRRIPDTQMIPVHYGLDGTVDRYGDKWEGLLLLPLVGVGLAVLSAVVPRIEPRSGNLLRSPRAYFTTTLSSTLLLFAIHGAIVFQALGWSIDVVCIVGIAVSLLLVVTGNYLSKVRSNFSFGIRTPWTLSSERSWYRTNRLGGWLMVLLGLGGIIAVLTNIKQLFILLTLGGITGTSLFLVVYSYFVWKNDPDRSRTD